MLIISCCQKEFVLFEIVVGLSQHDKPESGIKPNNSTQPNLDEHQEIETKQVKRKLSKINDSLDKFEEPKKKEKKSKEDADVHSETDQQTTSGLDTDAEAPKGFKKKKKNRRKKHSGKNTRKKELEEESILLNLKFVVDECW